MCVCVFSGIGVYSYTHELLCIRCCVYMHMYNYMSICVCVTVYIL